MAQGNATAPSPLLGGALLGGVSVGTVVVLLLMAPVAHGLQFQLGYPRSGSVPSLACGAGQCANISLGFHGLASLDPTVLRLTLTPTDPSVVINGSGGRPLNLTYVPGSSPHWVGVFSGSTTSPTPFAAEIVDPSGQLVGAANPTILPGAILCLKGTLSSTYEFQLTVSYEGTSAHVLFAVS